MKKLKIATVFSGIGAFEQALLKMDIDHEVVFACDNGEIELDQTYEELLNEFEKLNHNNIDDFILDKYNETGKINYVKHSYNQNYTVNKWYEDIRFLDGKKYKDEIDILVGGSPCQSFSINGKRAGLEDTRGTLFYDYARLIEEIQPKVFIYENVPGMLSHDNGNTWKIIQEVFDSLGYAIHFDILNSVDFGIPQNRKRLFVVGFKDSYYNFDFPLKEKLTKTMFDYLEDNIDKKHYLQEKGFKFVTDTGDKQRGRSKVNQNITKTQIANQQFNWIGDFVFEKIDKVKNNKEIMERAYIGTYKDEIGVVRQLTHRECLRLMGFSDSFKICVPNVQAYRQSGNSIVVNVLEAIMNSIIKTGVFNMKKKMVVGTLFSGIGAFEYALKKLGIDHEIAFAVDNGNIEIDYDVDHELSVIKKMNSIDDKLKYVDQLYKDNTRRKNFVQESYLANYDITNQRFFQDVKLFDGTDFEGKLDILVGGSPCQSFSTVGFQEGLEDSRGTLFYDYARIVSESKPKIFIYENVRGLITHDKGNTFAVVKGVFKSLGYELFIDVLNAKDYGIPQNRRRIFIIGFRNEGSGFNFPEEKKLEYNMKDFLQENISEGNFIMKDGIFTFDGPGEKVDDKYTLSPKLYNYVMSPGTKSFYQEPEIDLEVARPILATMGNRHRAGIDNYITVNGLVRMLTEREAHRLMGFDDEYKIVVSRAQGYRQAGNSISVTLLMEIIKEILKTDMI